MNKTNENPQPAEYEKTTGKKSSSALMEELLNDNSTEIKPVEISGLIDDDVFYHTVFLHQDGEFKPFVLTSEIDVLEVYDREEELKKENVKTTIKESDKYSYFTYNNKEYKFPFKLSFNDDLGINMINNGALKLIQDKEYDKNIYDTIREKVYNYYDHSESKEYDIATALIIESYIDPILGRTSYYLLYGSQDTGKTTIQKTMAKLQFKGRFAGKSTVPVLVRLTHYLGVNQHLDEFSKLNPEERGIFMSWANTGFYKGGSYEMVNPNKKNLKDQITVFKTFSQKSFSVNDLKYFPDDFLSRCYINTTTRKNRNTNDINKIPDNEIKDFQNITNKTFVYCLLNWKNIIKDIEYAKKELEKEGLFGRRTEIYSTIIGIIKHFKGDYHREIKDWLASRDELKNKIDEDKHESLIIKCIINKIRKEEVVEISNKEIIEYMKEKLDIKEDSEYKPNPANIGRVIKEFGFIRSPEDLSRSGKTGNIVYKIRKNLLLDILNRFNMQELKKQYLNPPSEPSETSEPSVNKQKNTEGTEGTEGTEANKRKVY